MAKYVLIGGGDIRTGETEKIDFEIVNLSDKKEANVLFIGLASSYSDSYFDAVKKQYKKLGCSCNYLKKSNLINNPDLVKDKINSADIIYIGGGDSLKLMERIKMYNLDKLFCELDNEKIIVGMSAGAIICTKMGLSDSMILRGESEELTFVEGLGLIDLNICPHYNKTIRRVELKNKLLNSDEKVLGIEDKVAIVVTADEIKIIKSNDDANAYFCYYKDGKYIEEVFYGLG